MVYFFRVTQYVYFVFYIQSRKVYLPSSLYFSSFSLSQSGVEFLRNLVKQKQNLPDYNSNRTKVRLNLNNFGNLCSITQSILDVPITRRSHILLNFDYQIPFQSTYCMENKSIFDSSK